MTNKSSVLLYTRWQVQRQKSLIEKSKRKKVPTSLDPEAYGGEAVMGSVSKEAYDYWTKNPSRDFDAYMAEYRDSNIVGKVPKKCTDTQRLVRTR